MEVNNNNNNNNNSNNNNNYFYYFLLSPVTSSLLGPNTPLSTLFSNTFSLRSSLSVSDQASHTYKTTGKIIVLYISIYVTVSYSATTGFEIYGETSSAAQWQRGERKVKAVGRFHPFIGHEGP
jgi:hypothetical protein